MDDKTRNLLLGFAGGVAVSTALPLLAPIIAEVARPIAKALLKQGLLSLDKLRTNVARSSESIEDLIAEVRAELDEELTSVRRGAETVAGGGSAVSSPTTAGTERPTVGAKVALGVKSPRN